MPSGGTGVGSKSSIGVDTSSTGGVVDVACSSFASSLLVLFPSPYLHCWALCITSALSVSDEEYVEQLKIRFSYPRHVSCISLSLSCED